MRCVRRALVKHLFRCDASVLDGAGSLLREIGFIRPGRVERHEKRLHTWSNEWDSRCFIIEPRSRRFRSTERGEGEGEVLTETSLSTQPISSGILPSLYHLSRIGRRLFTFFLRINRGEKKGEVKRIETRRVLSEWKCVCPSVIAFCSLRRTDFQTWESLETGVMRILSTLYLINSSKACASLFFL